MTMFAPTEDARAHAVKTLPEKLASLTAGLEVIAGEKKFLFSDEKPTIADIALNSFAEGFAQRGVDMTPSCPGLKRVIENVAALPQLAV
jgi:glutathione S-transferase